MLYGGGNPIDELDSSGKTARYIRTLCQHHPFGYNSKWGYYYNRETQLYLCKHRMYDASTGRWLNRDPIGYAGGTNLYGYCGSGLVGAANPKGTRIGREKAAVGEIAEASGFPVDFIPYNTW